MENYELTVVVSGKATPAKVKSARELIEKLIKTYKGKINRVDEWGKIEFAYKIREEQSGIFLHFPLELEPSTVKTIDSKLRLEEEIVRYLLIKKREK